MKVYIDTADWWIGYYRGPNHHYVCPIPTVVVRWKRSHCTCLRGLPPRGMGYRPAPPCSEHGKTRTAPPRAPSGRGGGS